MSKPRSIFGPLLLIAVGAVWLLTKSGSIPSSNLWALSYIWPYVLIAAGIGIILRSYWAYASVLMDVVIIGGAVLAIFYAPQLGWNAPSSSFVIHDGDFYVGPGEAGSGKVITESRKVDDFTTIELDYPAEVFVTQGDSVSVKIEAEDNLLPGLQTRVRNDTLEIFYKTDDNKHVNQTKPVKIMIVVKDLKEVDLGSAGQLNLEGIESDKLDISVSGAGDLKLKDIAVKNLSVTLSGAGNITASGKADDFRLVISGAGSFNGKDLHSKTVDVNLSGAGSATVWVDDQLDAQISGFGSVNYYGSPNVTKQISGLGGVNHSGDK